MIRDQQVRHFEKEINALGDNLTLEKADLLLKRIDLQMKLEDLNAKKREFKYSKFLTLSPVALPVMAALLAFTGSMVANTLQTWSQFEAPRNALILKTVETADQTKTAERLLFLNEAGLIELKPEQKKYLESVVPK